MFSQRNIFLIDSTGAFITSILSSFILIKHCSDFGIEAHCFRIFGTVAGIYCIYSFIAVPLMLYNQNATMIAFIFYFAELLVVSILLFVEFRVLKSFDRVNI